VCVCVGLCVRMHIID